MLVLLTLVNVGIAARASPLHPVTPKLCRCGMRPRMIAASRYSSEVPSRQTTTTGHGGGWYVREVTENEDVENDEAIGVTGISRRNGGGDGFRKPICFSECNFFISQCHTSSDLTCHRARTPVHTWDLRSDPGHRAAHDHRAVRHSLIPALLEREGPQGPRSRNTQSTLASLSVTLN